MNVFKIIFVICFFHVSTSMPIQAQDLPSVPPSVMDSLTQEGNSLADMLKTDLLKRLVEAQKEKMEPGKSRIRRPRPELGKGRSDYDPIDLSKYIGTEGDPNKAYQTLQELGKVPGPEAAPFPKLASPEEDRWKSVAPEKRMAHIEDLLKRRRFKEGLSEVENLLDSKLSEEQKIDTLVLREKLLFQDKRYEMVESDYFRLKSYYPKSNEIQDLFSYLEKEAGLAPLQEEVMANPADPDLQRKLLDQYLKYEWLDMAEEFFADTIQDTSKPTIESLSEIYYRKRDFPMLVKLSEAAYNAHPGEAVFLYNQAVGVLNEQHPGARSDALELLQKARTLARTPAMQKRIEWYLNKLKK